MEKQIILKPSGLKKSCLKKHGTISGRAEALL
jgi:hypothetical protein